MVVGKHGKIYESSDGVQFVHLNEQILPSRSDL